MASISPSQGRIWWHKSICLWRASRVSQWTWQIWQENIVTLPISSLTVAPTFPGVGVSVFDSAEIPCNGHDAQQRDIQTHNKARCNVQLQGFHYRNVCNYVAACLAHKSCITSRNFPLNTVDIDSMESPYLTLQQGNQTNLQRISTVQYHAIPSTDKHIKYLYRTGMASSCAKSV